MKTVKLICFIFLIISLRISSANDIDFEEIQPGIFVHQGEHHDIDENYDGDICNVGFIIGDESVAVIDTGGSPAIGQKILNAIKEKTSLPIRFVINTHVHLDHIYGNIAFLDEDPIYIGHSELPKAMKLRKSYYEKINQDFLGLSAKDSVQVIPTVLVKAKEIKEIDLGNRILKIEAYPKAHTNTDITIEDINTKTAWLGDLLFTERTPSIDGDIHGFIDALDVIKNKNYKKIIPGHGSIPKKNNKALKKIKKYLELLRDGIKEAIENGLGIQESIEIVALSEKNEWELFEIQNARNINMVYPIMEWE